MCMMIWDGFQRYRVNLPSSAVRDFFFLGGSSVKELLKTDNKRPDGYTLIPWQAGRNLTWDVSIRCSIVHSNHVCDCGRCYRDRVRAQDCAVCGALEYILLLSHNFRDVWTNKRSRPLLPVWTRSPNSWLHWRSEGNRTSTSAYFGDHPTVQFHFVSWQLCGCIMWETTLVMLSRISPSIIICNTFRNQVLKKIIQSWYVTRHMSMKTYIKRRGITWITCESHVNHMWNTSHFSVKVLTLSTEDSRIRLIIKLTITAHSVCSFTSYEGCAAAVLTIWLHEARISRDNCNAILARWRITTFKRWLQIAYYRKPTTVYYRLTYTTVYIPYTTVYIPYTTVSLLPYTVRQFSSINTETQAETLQYRQVFSSQNWHRGVSNFFQRFHVQIDDLYEISLPVTPDFALFSKWRLKSKMTAKRL